MSTFDTGPMDAGIESLVRDAQMNQSLFTWHHISEALRDSRLSVVEFTDLCGLPAYNANEFPCVAVSLPSAYKDKMNMHGGFPQQIQPLQLMFVYRADSRFA